MSAPEDTRPLPPPKVRLPARVPTTKARPVQSNIPSSRADRDRLARAAAAWVEAQGLTPPLDMADLRAQAEALLRAHDDPAVWVDYAGVLINNAAWRETLAGVPFARRLLLLPKCLRLSSHCPAPFDAIGLLCKSCGLCSLEDLTTEAERLGYAVLVAEGSAVVRRLVETGQVEAVVGVACLNVLERSFPHLEAGAVPGLAIPLLQDDCLDTNVDLEAVWDVIHLTSADHAARLDLDALKDEVRGWFHRDALDAVLGPSDDPTDDLVRRALAADGNRWRPFLAATAWIALRADAGDADPRADAAVRTLAVALECFHKASLVHDDIEDGDDRRGALPTLHATHGVPVALNVGDLLVGEGYRLLAGLDAPADVRAAVVALAAAGHATLCRGQGAELLRRARGETPSSLEVLDVFRQKTAPAFEVALGAAARLAGADDDVLRVLAAFSEGVGIAYQVKDDLEDAAHPDQERDARGSLLLAIARRRVPEGPDGDAIARASAGGPLDAGVVDVLARHGVLDKARELQRAYEEQALKALRELRHPTVKGLLRRVVGRIFPQDIVEGVCRELEARHAADGASRAEGARSVG